MTDRAAATGDRSRTVAVTGASGSLAADLIPGLLARGYRIVAIDNRRPESDLGPGELRWEILDVTDRLALAAALRGVGAVVHLAGIPLETDWDALLRTNIDGTEAVLDAAHRAGAERVVLASSIHAAGFVEIPDGPETVPDAVAVRPDTFYGVSKAASEALGSLYHDRYGLDVVCLRIASRYSEPVDERMLSTWLSPADAVRLVDAALTVDRPGFRIVWGVSANSRGYLSPAGGRALGFVARDDAEDYAAGLFESASRHPEVRATEWDRRFIGGRFCSPHPPRVAPHARPA